MSFALRMRGVADKLLTKYDERTNKIKMVIKGAKTWDPVLGEYTFSTDTEQEITGVAVPYSLGSVDGTTIQVGDIKLTITNDVQPLLTSNIILDGKEYSVVSIQPFAYTGADLNIAYAVQLRG